MAGPMRQNENGEWIEDFDTGDYSQWQDSGVAESGTPFDGGGGSSGGSSGGQSSDPGILDLVKAASSRWSAESGRAAPDWNDPTDAANFERFKTDYLGMVSAGQRDPYDDLNPQRPGPIASVMPRQPTTAASRPPTPGARTAAQTPGASASVTPGAAATPAATAKTHLQTPLFPIGNETSPRSATRTVAAGTIAPEVSAAVQAVRSRGGTIDDLLTEVAGAAWRKESGRRDGPDKTDPVDLANYARYLEDWKGVFKAGQQAPLVRELRAAIARPVAPAARPPVVGAGAGNTQPVATGGTPAGYPAALSPRATSGSLLTNGMPLTQEAPGNGPPPIMDATDGVYRPDGSPLVPELKPLSPGDPVWERNQPLPENLAPNQFKLELSNEEAMAACGPAAAIAFARMYNRNPTGAEAVQLAKEVGWTPDGGMAGTQSQVALLNKLGVPSRMEEGVNFAKVDQEIDGGRAVIIDTVGSARLPAGHYFVLYRRDQQGRYLVGGSGEALKGGAAWMSPQEITALAGAPRNAIFMGLEENPRGQAVGPNGPEALGPPAPVPVAPASAPAQQSGGLGPIPVEGLRSAIESAARQHGIDPALIAGVIEAESQWGAQRGSPAGARGVMQLMPGTARELGVNPDDDVQAIEGGARYLAKMIAFFDGDEEAGLAAYNYGPGNVQRVIRTHGRANFRNGLPQETLDYLQRVPAFRRKYQVQAPPPIRFN